jgi:hypothetical protein
MPVTDHNAGATIEEATTQAGLHNRAIGIELAKRCVRLHTVDQPLFGAANKLAQVAKVAGLRDWRAIDISNDRCDPSCGRKSILYMLDLCQIKYVFKPQFRQVEVGEMISTRFALQAVDLLREASVFVFQSRKPGLEGAIGRPYIDQCAHCVFPSVVALSGSCGRKHPLADMMKMFPSQYPQLSGYCQGPPNHDQGWRFNPVGKTQTEVCYWSGGGGEGV